MFNLEEIIYLCKKAITKDNWLKDRECTISFLNLFNHYGEKNGFTVQYEDHPKEFLDIDMVWWKNGRLVAAIEHENVKRSNPIDDEWKKLAYVDADMGILVAYCTPEDERREWLKRAAGILVNKPNKLETRYFLILGDQQKKDFRGYEFDSFGTIKKTIEL